MNCGKNYFCGLKKNFDIAVIGGGASGYFAAIHAASSGVNKVVILEKTAKPLSKVAISGGGRCNVTHNCMYESQLVKFYPRGGKELKKAFAKFGTKHTIEWFESRGVGLKTENDGRMFPISDSSQTIIECLQKTATDAGVKLQLRCEVVKVKKNEESDFTITLKNLDELRVQKVIVATGGFNKLESYKWLSDIGLIIQQPIPSLFTFNIPYSNMKDLMGISVQNGSVKIPGTKWKSDGPVLITHWGFSGPAVIKLSAWAAKYLHGVNYQFPILINWIGKTDEEALNEIAEMKINHYNKKILKYPMFHLPLRLWEKLCAIVEIDKNLRWTDISKKKMNKLIEVLIRQPFAVSGKTTFKEEFVTCGGVLLSEVEITTFESKKHPGIYITGEVLDVDGLTGGFNFQHAWTSGFLAGSHASGSLRKSHLPKGQ